MLIASWGMHERVVFRSQLEAVGVRLIISRISLSLSRSNACESNRFERSKSRSKMVNDIFLSSFE